VQNFILDNLGSLHCCHSYVIVSGVISNVYLTFINFHIEFDNIHVIYLIFVYLLSSKPMMNMIHNKVT